MMYSEKVEHALCSTCLASGRQLFRVGGLAHVYTLVASTANVLVDAEAAASVAVCWECQRLLQRIDKFRTQVVSVGILMQSLHIEPEKNDYSLSTLSTSDCKVGEDYILQQGGELQRNGDSEVAQVKEDSDHVDESGIADPIETEDYAGPISIRRMRGVFAVDIRKEVTFNMTEPSFDEMLRLTGIGEEDWCWRPSGRRQVKRTAKMMSLKLADELDEPRPRRRRKNAKSVKPAKQRIKGEKVIAIEMTETEMRRSREEMRERKKYATSGFKCETCIAAFTCQQLLDRHRDIKHSEEAGSHVCEICSVHTRSTELLAAHRRTHYTLYSCLCGFTLRSLNAVVRHYRTRHEPTHKYVCKTCGKEFPTERTLRYHRECEHKARQKCEHCGKLFNNKATFKRHLLQHTGMPMYECDICHKSYRGTFGLRAHMRTHAPLEHADEAFCAECNVQFKNKYLYRHHLKTNAKHAEPDNFRFPCTMCDKRFFVQSQLRMHEDTVHLKKTTHKCPHCDKGFATVYRMQNHVKSVHERRPVPKTHICETCGRRFATKQQVMRHQVVHTGVRAFACRFCTATFRQSAALYTHTKILHKNE